MCLCVNMCVLCLKCSFFFHFWGLLPKWTQTSRSKTFIDVIVFWLFALAFLFLNLWNHSWRTHKDKVVKEKSQNYGGSKIFKVLSKAFRGRHWQKCNSEMIGRCGRCEVTRLNWQTDWLIDGASKRGKKAEGVYYVRFNRSFYNLANSI